MTKNIENKAGRDFPLLLDVILNRTFKDVVKYVITEMSTPVMDRTKFKNVLRKNYELNKDENTELDKVEGNFNKNHIEESKKSVLNKDNQVNAVVGTANKLINNDEQKKGDRQLLVQENLEETVQNPVSHDGDKNICQRTLGKNFSLRQNNDLTSISHDSTAAQRRAGESFILQSSISNNDKFASYSLDKKSVLPSDDLLKSQQGRSFMFSHAISRGNNIFIVKHDMKKEFNFNKFVTESNKNHNDGNKSDFKRMKEMKLKSCTEVIEVKQTIDEMKSYSYNKATHDSKIIDLTDIEGKESEIMKDIEIQETITELGVECKEKCDSPDSRRPHLVMSEISSCASTPCKDQTTINSHNVTAETFPNKVFNTTSCLSSLSECKKCRLSEVWKYNTGKCVDASPLVAVPAEVRSVSLVLILMIFAAHKN